MNRPVSTSGPLESLTEEDWRVLRQQLLLHVYKKYWWFYLRTGRSLEGLVQEAFLALLSGRRRYPPMDRHAGLERHDVTHLAFLCETIRSLVSRQYHVSLTLENLDRVAQFQESHLYPYLFSPPDAESSLTYKQLLRTMLELVQDDPVVHRIVQLKATEPDLRPREIAERLNITMEQMYAAQKRLNRRLERFKEKLR